MILSPAFMKVTVFLSLPTDLNGKVFVFLGESSRDRCELAHKAEETSIEFYLVFSSLQWPLLWLQPLLLQHPGKG